MKKFLGGIKKNIFYISLITGMAVLVTVLGLYNAQTNSKEKTITIGQNTPTAFATVSSLKRFRPGSRKRAMATVSAVTASAVSSAATGISKVELPSVLVGRYFSPSTSI